MRKISPGIFKKFRVFLFLIFSFTAVTAQNTITGKVTDEKTGTPVIGATVTVKGTRTAVQTNNTGSFTINAPANSRLVITSVGFTTQEVAAANNVSVSMAPTAG